MNISLTNLGIGAAGGLLNEPKAKNNGELKNYIQWNL